MTDIIIHIFIIIGITFRWFIFIFSYFKFIDNICIFNKLIIVHNIFFLSFFLSIKLFIWSQFICYRGTFFKSQLWNFRINLNIDLLIISLQYSLSIETGSHFFINLLFIGSLFFKSIFLIWQGKLWNSRVLSIGLTNRVLSLLFCKNIGFF